MRRAERAAEAGRLHDEGLNGLEIAARMGISISYAYELVNDPEGVKIRARKESYRGTCEDCGGSTHGHDGRHGEKAARRCPNCDRERARSDIAYRLDHAEKSKGEVYTDEQLIASLQAVYERAGRPIGGPLYDTLRYPWEPSNQTIIHRFGGWWEACDLARIPRVNSKRRSYSRISDAECIAAVVRVATEFGRVPTLSEYRAFRVDRPELGLPSEVTIRMRLGGWGSVTENLLLRAPVEQVAA